MAHALSGRGLNTSQADELLREMQHEQILDSDPTKDFMDIRFPILVVEGKAYGTAKSPSEAENQAAAAGSCMANLLQQLTDVHSRCVPDSRRGTRAPVAFSISMCGPVLQLSVHYPLVQDNITSYHMIVLKGCHACIGDDLEAFLLMSEHLMSWNKEVFLTEIVGQLFEWPKSTLYENGSVPAKRWLTRTGESYDMVVVTAQARARKHLPDTSYTSVLPCNLELTLRGHAAYVL